MVASRYNFPVPRLLLLLAFLLCWSESAWSQRRRQAPPPPPEPDQEEESAEPEYTFNPIQAQKELQVGDFYFKKKNYHAAAGRYERATKWQPDLAEAYYRLGEAREKLDQKETALAAFQKYLELFPSSRKAARVKKKIAQLRSKSGKPDERPGPRAPTTSPRSF